MKNKYILILIASVLFISQLAIAQEDHPPRSLFAAVLDSETTPEIISQLIEAGAKVNARTPGGHTPLMFAAQYNQTPEVCTVLIKAGAEVNAHDNDGKSPLIYAARHNNLEVCTVLIKVAAEDTFASPDCFHSPLRYAARYNSPEVCEALIKAGANINARDKYGNKAIDYAKKNDALKNTDVYWKLHDASFE